MSQKMDIHLRQVGEVIVLDIAGDITAFAEEPIFQAYQNASERGTSKMVLMFRDDAYLNSAGIGILIGIAMESRRKGERVRLVEPSRHFQKIFEMVGLSRYLPLCETEAEALAGF